MGEVYRANDTNLKRQVAIKVLRASFSEDVDRLARFQREAEVLAALNHQNIANIYGVERAGSTTALVMELVEGSTLAERIARGPLRLHEALAIAKQIAEALESAHERGIVHRDLKPANVKVRDDGTVKVLDFGLAKVIEQQGTLQNQSQSSTIAATIATQTGVILGTPAYMSPEQVRGHEVDARADVWAFGCVLFEMLSGRSAFPSETMADALAGLVEREPEWKHLPSTTPQALRRLLRRCLAKDPRQRLRSIGDASLDLEEAGTGGRPSPEAVASTRRWLAPAIAALAILGRRRVEQWRHDRLE
jgi:serine/threonine-protein kinase